MFAVIRFLKVEMASFVVTKTPTFTVSNKVY